MRVFVSGERVLGSGGFEGFGRVEVGNWSKWLNFFRN